MTAKRPAHVITQTQATERHFTVKELAEMWKLDEGTIRKIFKDEDGVLVIGTNRLRRGTRQYATLRIPESVMLRVYFSRANRTSTSQLPDPSVSEMQLQRGRSASR